MTTNKHLSTSEVNSPIINIVAFVVTWGEKNKGQIYRKILKGLLPEVVKQHEVSQEELMFVLHRWQNISDEDMKTLARLLERGIPLVKWGWLIALFVGLFLVFTGGFAISTVNRMASNSSSISKTSKAPPRNASSQTPKISTDCISQKQCLLLADLVYVEDRYSQNFAGGQLTVKFSENGTPEDRLSIVPRDTEIGALKLEDNNLVYNESIIGTVEGGEELQPLVVTFNTKVDREKVQNVLRNVVYSQQSSETPSLKTRQIEFNLTDGDGGISNNLKIAMQTIAQENSLYLNVPSSQTTKENTELKITDIKIENAIAENLTVNLRVDRGTLTLKTDVAEGLTADKIRGNKTRNVTLTGTSTQINKTLSDPSALVYRGNRNYNGNDTLNITANEAIKGLVWPPTVETSRQDSNRVTINIQPANYSPTVNVPGQKFIQPNTDLPITGIRISDRDSQNVNLILNVRLGKISVQVDGIEGLTIEGNQSQKVVLKGTVEQLKTLLAKSSTIIYQCDRKEGGEDVFSVTVNDGKAGDTDNFNILVNDNPILSIPDFVTLNNNRRVTQIEAMDIIRKYLEAKSRIFAPPFDRQLASRLLMGKAYEDKVSKPGGGSLEWLRDNRAYYQYSSDRTLEPLQRFQAFGNQARIDVKLAEKLRYYQYGRLKWSSTNRGNYTFILQLDNGVLKIADVKSI
ncbi:MAG: ARC6/PARC6 family protein [Cyanobacteria bacterium SBLK]|nr:ARC6/PARC6 family protein [Cyanobacteria bacterium SBLK]